VNVPGTEPHLYLFSAYLGYLGVLGDRLFPWCFGAWLHRAAATKKKPIAEDAEVAEVRREEKRSFALAKEFS
jgi:hypothetical protein